VLPLEDYSEPGGSESLNSLSGYTRALRRSEDLGMSRECKSACGGRSLGPGRYV
jgi:hypothetical protein